MRRAASEFKARHDRLDVLINNAGVLVPTRRVTEDGFEETFAVNHLAHFLLTRELLDVLHAGAPARVVNVSSVAHRGSGMCWEDLQFSKHRYGQWRAYTQSKLANVLFTYELARRLDPRKVTANVLHPGAIGSGFGQTYGGLTAFVIRMGRPFLLTPEAGARTSVYLASSPEVAGVTGKYFAKCKEVRSSAISYNEASQKKLWAISEEMIKLQRAGAEERSSHAAA